MTRSEIRSCEREDVPNVMEIFESSLPSPWSERSVIDILSSPDTIFLVSASPCGELNGFVILHRACDEGEIYIIAVKREYRREGIGSALLYDVMKKAALDGAKTVYLEVRKSDIGARKFYRRNGFEECGERRGYYDNPKDDAVLMERSL